MGLRCGDSGRACIEVALEIPLLMPSAGQVVKKPKKSVGRGECAHMVCLF